MKNKLEQTLDVEFAHIGISPLIYHFRDNCGHYSAITIVDTQQSWIEVRLILDRMMPSWFSHLTYEGKLVPPNIYFRDFLHENDLFGYAFFAFSFNRRLGRIIAKGRLLKHLKEMKK